MLGLDLIVRDEQYNLIEPNHISATEMYNLHLKVTQEIKDKTNRNSHLYRSSRHFERSDPPLCHSIGKIYSWNPGDLFHIILQVTRFIMR